MSFFAMSSKVVVEPISNQFKALARSPKLYHHYIYARLSSQVEYTHIKLANYFLFFAPYFFHTSMANPACSGKLNVEVEVKSNADKVWEALRDFIFIFPKAFPNDYKSVEVLEGDGIVVGSVRLITYGEGIHFFTGVV